MKDKARISGVSSIVRRRTVLSGMAASLASPFVGTARSALASEGLILHGPPAGPSITIANAVAGDGFSDVGRDITFRIWRNPDEIRAGIASGTMQAVVMPITTAANLYTRGLGVRLLNVMTDGLLQIVSRDKEITDIASLKGTTMAVPFRNALPEYVLQSILAKNGLVPGEDITLETTGSPIEAVQLLLAGRIDAAMVPEPAGSAALMMAKKANLEVFRGVDVQEEWGRLTGAGPVLPQAGLAITNDLVEAAPDLVESIQSGLDAVVTEVNANPDAAAKTAGAALQLPAPIIAASIPHSKLVARRVSESKKAIDAMLALVAEVNPKAIGGQLPDDGLYL